MNIHTDITQSSLDWLVRRAGVVTASEFDQIMTPAFKKRDGQMPHSYMCRKLAEKWIGPLPSFNSIDMDFGRILEEDAIPFYELEFSEKIERVAFITNDAGTIGCSPDGLIGDDGGIEVKCPRAETHVKYLLSKELPADYACQVHGSMYVTGRPWWKFLSFHRRLPPLVLTVFRDDAIQEEIARALESFMKDLSLANQELEAINGGPPRQFTVATPQPKYEVEDIFV